MHNYKIFGVLMVGLTSCIGISAMPLSAHKAGSPEPHGEQPHGEQHMHNSVEVPAGQPLPTVSLVVHPDSRRGWNLEMQVTNFKLAPEHINQADQSNGINTREGHAHLYIDGVKITRLYSNWYYLESLEPGMRQINVSLNTNSHDTITHKSQPIQAIVMLNVPASAR